VVGIESLTVLKPEPVEVFLTLFGGKTRAFSGYGSSFPRERSCFLLTIDAATIANVVRTAPMPQENTSDVFRGSVVLII